MAPRKALTIQEKANLIEEASKPGMTQAKLCEKHKIPKSTLSKILREKDSVVLTFSGPSESQQLTDKLCETRARGAQAETSFAL